MLKAYCWLMSRLRIEKGATAVEYAIMVALIATVIIGVVTALGLKLNAVFETVRNKLP